MHHCAAIADKAGLPIYLTSFSAGHDLYLKLGYEDVAYFDIDLSAYARKMSGYGMHRTYGMLRPAVKKDAS